MKKLQTIWTSDDRKLGLAQRLFHRIEGVEPKVLLYGTYLQVENFELGSTYFIPTDFLIEEASEEGKLRVSKTFQEIQQLTWFRMPTFIASGKGREEPLPVES
ncbi:MAG: hypothetical protein ACK2T3_10295 [Candidatus Promineifilaceae bacterium]